MLLRIRYAIVLLLAALGAAAPASAQYAPFPCTWAPGERQVGQTMQGPVVVPLCINEAPGQASSSSPAGTYAAFAFHEDASDIWIDGSYVGPNHFGARISLEQCTRVMGSGCQSGGTWGNATLVVYRNGRGVLFWALAYDKAGVAKAQKDCRGDAFLPCEQVYKFGSSTREHFPGNEIRKRYLAAAWVAGEKGYDGKLYIASGEPTFRSAAEKAIKACQAATGAPECTLIDYTADGILLTFRSDTNDGALVETTAARAIKAAERRCKKAKVRCTLQAQFDARKAGQFVHEFSPGSQPK